MIRENKKLKKYRAPYKQKLLLLLQGGLALALTRSPRKYYLVLKSIPKSLRTLDRMYLYRTIREFERDRLIDFKEKDDGTILITLSEQGEHRMLTYRIDDMKIEKPAVWDGKWRLVLFDIPEQKRAARDALRLKLKDLGFKELQHSVHILPYPCKDEIDFLMEFFSLTSCVYYAEIESLSNEARWIERFDLTRVTVKR